MIGQIDVRPLQRPAVMAFEKGEAVIERAAAQGQLADDFITAGDQQREIAQTQAGRRAVHRLLHQRAEGWSPGEARMAVVRARRVERASDTGRDLSCPVQLQTCVAHAPLDAAAPSRVSVA
jgi:hypothetical protein